MLSSFFAFLGGLWMEVLLVAPLLLGVPLGSLAVPVPSLWVLLLVLARDLCSAHPSLLSWSLHRS